MLLVVAVVGLLTACASSPWGMANNTGVVTNNPDSLPNVAWQTPDQRQELVQENNALASQQIMSSAAVPEAAAPATEPPRKISVSLLVPLSGKKSDLGRSMLKAAQMALFDIGSANFQLVPRDTKGTPDGAAAAATAAVEAKTDMILGPIFADDLKLVKPIAEAANIPVISFTTDWTLAGNDTYIMGFLPFIQVARVARYAQAKGYSNFSVFAPQTEYCDVVIRTLESSGVSVRHVERYASLQQDLTELVKDFAESNKTASPSGFNFDAMLLPVGSEGLRTLVQALGEADIAQPKVRFVGTGLWDEVGLTSNPALFGGWFAAPDPVLRADFEKRFQNNYGTPPMRLSSLAYDATALAAVLARSAQPGTMPYTKDAITNPRGFAGIDGIFRFRSDGLSERGLAVLEIQSGRTIVVDRAPTAFVVPGS